MKACRQTNLSPVVNGSRYLYADPLVAGNYFGTQQNRAV
jgi:hypothetical protein